MKYFCGRNGYFYIKSLSVFIVLKINLINNNLILINLLKTIIIEDYN